MAHENIRTSSEEEPVITCWLMVYEQQKKMKRRFWVNKTRNKEWCRENCVISGLARKIPPPRKYFRMTYGKFTTLLGQLRYIN
jgi:hypothetical protein